MQDGIGQHFKAGAVVKSIFRTPHSWHRMPRIEGALIRWCRWEKEVTLVPESAMRIRADFTYDYPRSCFLA
jgi:hypothetical protein